MSRFSSPISEPEITSPAAQVRLAELEAKHELEAEQLARLESLAKLMDAQFNIPLLPIPIGLDTIVGLVPGIGDTISLGVAGYIVAGAHRINMPASHLTRMGGNIFIDWLIGLVPVIGDIFDVGWRGNMRNVKIARSHLEERWAKERAAALNT
jgi:hypothetical protein